MPKVKALHSIGVAQLLGSHGIPNADGIIPNGAKLELSDEQIELIGNDSFEPVSAEETPKNMSEETTPVTLESQPEQTPVTPETDTLPTPDASTETTPVTPAA